MAHEFNDTNFEKEVLQSEMPVLVDFWAPWCGPCRQQGPIIDKLAENMKDRAVKIGKVNVDEAPAVSQKYQIMSIPTLIIFKNGQLVEQLRGVHQEDQLLEKLKKHM